MNISLPKLEMQYRSFADLNADIIAWLPRLPRDLSLVVGVPRSGLLAANLVALHLNLPLADLEGYIANRILGGGKRLAQRIPPAAGAKRKTLIVDDSYGKGTAMAETRELLARAGVKDDLYFAVVYVSPGTESKVDYFAQVVKQPRAFEWNVMHHQNLVPNSCMDIDGVLCRDPTEEENDDGPNYRRFLTEVPPRFIPTFTVSHLVTSRLEKYRPETEAWLAKHQVPYRQLDMLDLPSARERVRLGCHAAFKASVYRQSGALMFYESSRDQALEIAQRTGNFVFCTDTREMIQPGVAARSRWVADQVPRRLLRKVRELLGGRPRLRPNP